MCDFILLFFYLFTLDDAIHLMTIDGKIMNFFKKIPVTSDFNSNLKRLEHITKSYNKKTYEQTENQ